MTTGYPCPCCGREVFEEPPGCHLICPICCWEDDLVQLRWPGRADGANKVSLVQAQRNYVEFGVSERRFMRNVRAPGADEPVADAWRPIDLDVDDFEDAPGSTGGWPEDRTVLYWWSERFWRRQVR